MQKREAKSHVSSKWVALCLSVMLCLALPTTSFTQSDSAQISGFIKDPSGAAVPGASVVIKNEGSNYERTAKTNDSGYYIITALPPGFYTVTVEAGGFKKFQQTKKKLDPSIATTVDAELTLGEVTETIEVVASVSSVQSETATVGKLIEAEQIQYMQLNGRNPLFLAALKPGVRSNNSLARFGFAMDSGGFNINGGRSQDNLITFDGAVAVRTRSNGTSIGTVDADAISEVQILTANYNAEYGRSAGGQIRMVTKSGSRDFHGTVYEFFRNSALDANTWTRNRTVNNTAISGSPDPFRFNQFGYNVSGPVILPGFNKDKNKLFFLWGQEWVRRRAGQTVTTTVPSLAMRRGDFSELLNASNPFFGRVVTIRDPQTGQPFAGNLIPADRLSRNGTALLNAYPAPVAGFQQGTNNFVQQRPTETDQRKDTISIDWNPSEKHQVRWRVSNFNYIDTSAFRANTDRAPQIIDRPNNTTSLAWTWTVSPTMVNEFLATASADRVHIYVDTRGDRYKRSNYGINYPYIYPDRKEISDKIPTVNFNSSTFVTQLDGGPYPAASSGPIYNFSNNFTMIRGNHTLKFGGLFERAGQNDFDQINVAGVPGGTNNQNGRFEFSNSRAGGSGLDLADAALGLFFSYAEIGVRSYTPYRGHMYEWFVQDSWKIRSNLRVELGLRHSIIQPYYSLWRNMVVFDPKLYDPSKAVTQNPANGYILSGDQYNGLAFPGDGFPDEAKGRVPVATTGEFDRLFRGLSKEYSQIHKRDFQPRVGLAYSINEKTVVRAGGGRFMTRLGVSDSVFLGGNPPLQPMVSISNGNVDAPGGAGGSNAFPFNVTTQDPVFKNPTAWTWNLTVERELPFKTTVEVAYVGRRGLRGQRERNLNQLQPGTIQANPGINPDFLRPYKGFGPIRVTNNDANSIYHGLQVGVNRRFSGGFSYGVAYTLGKSSDDGSAQRDIIPNAFDRSTLWGPSDYDNRHTMVINFIYELPWHRDQSTLAGKVLGGWQLTGVTQFQTGTPVTVAPGTDFAGVGSGSGPQIYNVNGDFKLSRGEQKFSESTSDQNFWFRPRNTDGSPIFVAPAAGTFTTQRNRNNIYQPGFQNWNAGIFKTYKFTESQNIQFRFEAFNWINHPNLGGENGGGVERSPTSAIFGKVTGKGSERRLQLSLRYSF